MDTKALRKKIIAKVKDSLPDEVIQDIAHLIQISEEAEIVFSEEQTFKIEKAIKSYEQGKYVSDEVAEQRIQQWLKE